MSCGDSLPPAQVSSLSFGNFLRGQVEQFPVAGVDKKAVEALDQALPGLRVLLGAVEDPGPGEDLAVVVAVILALNTLFPR